jgi:hypothetical protein
MAIVARAGASLATVSTLSPGSTAGTISTVDEEEDLAWDADSGFTRN